MKSCKFHWHPPHVIDYYSDGYPKVVSEARETCALPLGHDGHHQSANKVTTSGEIDD